MPLTEMKSHPMKKKNQLRVSRIRGFGCLFALGLILFGLFDFLVSSPYSGISSIHKARQNEAGNNIGAMNRTQQAYFLESQEFADSLQKLGVGINNPSVNYQYSIRATPLAVFNYATARTKNIKSYVGAIFLKVDNEQTGEILTVAIACETKSDWRSKWSKIPPPAPPPIVRGKGLECDPNTRDIAGTRDETEHSDLGKDSIETKRSDLENALKMAYSSFSYANAGQYDKALEVAQSINNADLKARALATIAITLAEKGQYDKALEVSTTIKDGSIKKRTLDAIARYQKSP